MRISSIFSPWLRSGLFWRTFFYLALLVIASMLTWFSSYRLIEQKPIANQKSAQIISIISITRSALTHSAPEKRSQLLRDLARNEGIQVYLLESDDKVELQEQTPLFLEIKKIIHANFNAETRFAQKVNNEEGFWVSFEIARDQYWLRLDQDKITKESGWQIMSWAAITLLLILIGAVFISRLINEPLSRLSIAARQIAKGEFPSNLPERGFKEIRETNASFNQMVEDLHRIDADRTIILAGISHDLRTPLTRMQLEVEMANLNEEAKYGMRSDIAQMDAIIHQFLDYAKPIEAGTIYSINLSDLLQHCAEEAKRLTDCAVEYKIEPDLLMSGSVTDLQRLFINIIENANRYGRAPITKKLKLAITCQKKDNNLRNGIVITFRDYGSGVPESSLEEIIRPFTRVNAARTQANGAGLGLAIVDRIVKRHGGQIQIENHPKGGLVVTVKF